MIQKIASIAVAVLTIGAAAACPAAATGTAKVWRGDGPVKTYTNVRIRLAREELALTTSDGVGTLVIGKAACTKSGALVECLPYDATLFQNGAKVRVALRSGTVWLNPTTSTQLLPDSSARVQPHGVVLLLTGRFGTSVSLNGIIDEVQR